MYITLASTSFKKVRESCKRLHMYSAKGCSEHKEERGRLKGQCEIIVSRKSRTIVAVRHKEQLLLHSVSHPGKLSDYTSHYHFCSYPLPSNRKQRLHRNVHKIVFWLSIARC